MATFADLSMLLLTFFVLLLSFSNMDVKQFREMLGSVQDAFGVQKRIAGSVEAISSSPVELSMDQNDGAGFASRPGSYDQEADDEMMDKIAQYVENQDLQDDVEVHNTPRGIVVRVKEGALYESGSAELDERSKKVLDKIAGIHGKFADSVQIEGHTDNIPIKSKKFPSNWELSTARAVTVVKFLQETGVKPAYLSASGYAEYQPAASNNTAEGKSQNRRIEIELMPNLDELPDLSTIQADLGGKKKKKGNKK